MTYYISIPVFNEEKNIYNIYTEIMKNESKIKQSNTEIENIIVLFVDDGSNDDTLKNIIELASKNHNVKYISFSKNFGKESAIFASMKYINKADENDFLFTLMDCDMQDPPSLIPELLLKMKNENLEAIGTCRKDRKGESPIRSLFSKLFYKIMKLLTNINMPSGMRDFCVMKKIFLQSMIDNAEKNTFFKGLFNDIGFKVDYVYYENINRVYGDTKWNFVSLFKYSLRAIVGFSNAPLILSSLLGIILFILSSIFLLIIIFRRLIFGDPVAGWASTISIILFISSLQFLCIGILGLYLDKNIKETVNKHQYIVAKTNI